MLFIILVAFSALFVAGCAAFFSIKGLIVLFSGSALAIGVMASSLELGKLVAASFLHTYWNRINFLLKTYLCLAVLVLMSITSLGIFGFLTGAYQTHATAVSSFETKITALQNEKDAVAKTIQVNSERVKTLTELRTGQEQRIQTAGNLKAPREQAYKAIEEANNEIKLKEEAVLKDRERVISLDKDISELQLGMNTTTDVGSFKFIANALNTDVQTSVQYFIFTLIAVFDPLAVALVLCWNKLIEERAARKKKEQEEYLAGLKSVQISEELPQTEEQIKIQPPDLPETSEDLLESSVEETDIIETVPPKPIVTKIPREKSSPKPVATPVDMVSALPIAEVADVDLEQHPEFKKMTVEEKNRELARRRKSSGKNDSIITS